MKLLFVGKIHMEIKRIIRFTPFVFFFFCALGLKVQASDFPTSAPLNPEFVEWSKTLEDSKAKNINRSATAEGHALGYIPSPVDLSHLRGLQLYQGAAVSALPSQYDLRSLGRLSPIRNQSTCGSCWTFAAYASLESSLLTNNETWDFSENNLKDTHGFDSGACDGGTHTMATAYLARWNGPISETDDPYSEYSNLSPSGLAPKKHIQEVLFIPKRANPLDNDNIKQTVMTYGALYATMHWEDSPFYRTYNTYFYDGQQPINHAVAIVGWDDNFAKAKFNPTPPGNGAFIVRNSWGASWGEGGYFYISYYDTRIGSENAMFNGAEPTNDYGRVYSYDPLGMTLRFGYNTDTAWFSNVFTSAANDQLSAVSFYTLTPNATYTLSIYTNTSSGPVSGVPALSQSGTISMPGYHTISLNAQIPITKDQKFSVVVKLTTPNFNYPVAIEKPIPKYSSQAIAGPGQSYISQDGTTWSDLTTLPNYANTNVCLKAFTAGTTGVSCTYTLSSAAGIAVTGNVNSVTITTNNSACTWSANSSASWLIISSATSSGTGSGTIYFTVTPNNTYYDRTAYINVEGQIYTVTQLGLSNTTINLLQNSDFENGAVNWVQGNSKGYAIITNNHQSAHGGNWFAYLGGIADMTDSLYQDITIPTNITTAYLRFWYGLYTEESWWNPFVADTLTVYALRPADNVTLKEIAAFSNLDAISSGWSWKQSLNYDLSAFKGQTIRLMFYAVNDYAKPTSFLIDDVSLNTISSESSCTFTVSPSSNSFTLSGGSGDINITTNTGSSCSWTAYSTAPWIAITSGGHGTGNGKVTYSVSANNSGSSRTGTISISGKSVTITQAVACTFSITRTSQSFTSTGGTGSVTVAASDSGCAWSAASSLSWITITSGSGTGSGTVTFSVSANTGADRTGNITIAGQTFVITQSGASCVYTLSPANQAFDAFGGTGSVNVTTSASNCIWTAISSVSWATITSSANGTGNGTVTYSISSSVGTDRTGSITIAGQTFIITQTGSVINTMTNLVVNPGFESGYANWYGVISRPASIVDSSLAPHAGSRYAWIGGYNGASDYIYQDVTIPSNAQQPYFQFWYSISTWETTTSSIYDTMAVEIRRPTDNALLGTAITLSNLNKTSGWVPSLLYDLSAFKGQGIRLRFYATTDSWSNPTSFRIDDVSLSNTVTTACTFSVSPASQTFTSAGGSGSVNVAVSDSGCAWTTLNPLNWVTITSGSSGNGGGTISFTVAANTSTSSRTGTLTIAGHTFTVTQSGIVCTYTTSPASQTFPSTGGTGSVTVVASDSICAWTAASSLDWVTITTGGNGTGNGTVNVSVAANTGGPRTGNITIASQTYAITQAAACIYIISPTSQTFNSSAGTGSVAVTASDSSCAWTTLNSLNWVIITSGSSGTGNGTVIFSVSENTTGTSRTGIITIADQQTFMITQSDRVFADVAPTNVFYSYINAIYNNNPPITLGCSQNPLMYCPDNSVTRGQMAAFIIRAKYGENSTYTLTPYFSDVPATNGFFKYVQKMKDTGITSVTGTYDVDGTVTRGQMAAFIIRAKYGENFTYTTTPYFSDVPATNGFFKYVQKMKDAGITSVTGSYNINGTVNRGAMAAFIARAFLNMP